MATSKKSSQAKPRSKAAAPKAKKATRTVPSVSPSRGKTPAWYLETLAAPERAIADQIMDLFVKAAPKATASIKWAQIVWESNGPFAFMKGNKAHVTLGFWRGAELEDAGGLLEGSGDRMRHLKLTAGSKLPTKAIAAFVKQALALNAANGDPTKR